MLKSSSLSWVIAGGLILAALPASAQAQTAASAQSVETEDSDFVTYVVKRGDNLYALARKYFQRIESYRTVQRLNRISNPYALPVGKRLRIPVAILRAEPLTAKVVAVRGNVRIVQGQRSLQPENGLSLTQGTTIETGDSGFITVQWPNGSRTSLPTLSQLSIVHLRRFLLTDSIDYDFTVEAGKANTKVNPLRQGGDRFRMRTPRAVAAVRGTEFRVGYGNDTSLSEVLEGKVATVIPGGPAELVGAGFGAVVNKDGIASEALLTPPELNAPGKVQVDPLVRLDFKPVPGAIGYHLQIALDAGFTDVIADARTEGTVFEVPDIPNGGMFVRGSAIANSGLEGLYQTYAMKRVLTGLAASMSQDADTLTFKWGGDGDGYRIYRFQVFKDKPEGIPVVDEPGLSEEGIAIRTLAPGTYHWRVGVKQFANDEVSENWLPFEKIIIAPPEP